MRLDFTTNILFCIGVRGVEENIPTSQKCHFLILGRQPQPVQPWGVNSFNMGGFGPGSSGDFDGAVGSDFGGGLGGPFFGPSTMPGFSPGKRNASALPSLC